jgi:hypothetical protein
MVASLTIEPTGHVIAKLGRDDGPTLAWPTRWAQAHSSYEGSRLAESESHAATTLSKYVQQPEAMRRPGLSGVLSLSLRRRPRPSRRPYRDPRSLERGHRHAWQGARAGGRSVRTLAPFDLHHSNGRALT